MLPQAKTAGLPLGEFKRRMKHISPSLVAADIPVRAPTRRALAKQQTRHSARSSGKQYIHGGIGRNGHR